MVGRMVNCLEVVDLPIFVVWIDALVPGRWSHFRGLDRHLSALNGSIFLKHVSSTDL